MTYVTSVTQSRLRIISETDHSPQTHARYNIMPYEYNTLHFVYELFFLWTKPSRMHPKIP
jgi:hypothetical protein